MRLRNVTIVKPLVIVNPTALVPVRCCRPGGRSFAVQDELHGRRKDRKDSKRGSVPAQDASGINPVRRVKYRREHFLRLYGS